MLAFDLFQMTFTASHIAKSFQICKMNYSYLFHYGTEPHFRKHLIELFEHALFVSTSFDESLNDIMQEDQMDLIIQLRNTKDDKINVHYLESRFLKRPNAIHLRNELLEAIKSFPLFNRKFIQLY